MHIHDCNVSAYFEVFNINTRVWNIKNIYYNHESNYWNIMQRGTAKNPTDKLKGKSKIHPKRKPQKSIE